MFKHGFQFSHRADPFAARELVDFGRRDRRLGGRVAEPVPCRDVALESRVPRVDEQQGRGPPLEYHVSERFEGPASIFQRSWGPTLTRSRSAARLRRASLRRLARAQGCPRKTVSRQIHEIERPRALALDAIDVRQPRLARRGARPRHAPAHQRVDQRRLADVRSSDQRDLRRTVARKILRRSGAPNEGGRDSQRSGLMAIG
jgi:hypothetical protein